MPEYTKNLTFDTNLAFTIIQLTIPLVFDINKP